MRRTLSPNRVNPADGTGVASMYKPLPPKNSKDGIDLAKRNIRAYSKEREVKTTPATSKNKIPEVTSRVSRLGCNGIVSVNSRQNIIRRSDLKNKSASRSRPIYKPFRSSGVNQDSSTSFTTMTEETLNDVAKAATQKGRKRSVSRQLSVDAPQQKRGHSRSRAPSLTGRQRGRSSSTSHQQSMERRPANGGNRTTHFSKTSKSRKLSVAHVGINHQAPASAPKQRGRSESRAPSRNLQAHLLSNRADSSVPKETFVCNRSLSVASRDSFLSGGHRSLADTVHKKTTTTFAASSSLNRSRSVNNSAHESASRSSIRFYEYGDYRRRINDGKFGESLDNQRELETILKNHWTQIQERLLILEKIMRLMDAKIHEAKIIKSIEDEKREKHRTEKENEKRREREEKRCEKQRSQKANREEGRRNMEEEGRRQLRRPPRVDEAEKQHEADRKRRRETAGVDNMRQYAAATDMELAENKFHRFGTSDDVLDQQHSSGNCILHRKQHDPVNRQQPCYNNHHQPLKREPESHNHYQNNDGRGSGGGEDKSYNCNDNGHHSSYYHSPKTAPLPPQPQVSANYRHETWPGKREY